MKSVKKWNLKPLQLLCNFQRSQFGDKVDFQNTIETTIPKEVEPNQLLPGL